MPAKRYYDQLRAEEASGEIDTAEQILESSSASAEIDKKWSKSRLNLKEQDRHDAETEDPYAGAAPIDPSKVKQYEWGDRMKLAAIKTKFAKTKFQNHERRLQYTVQQAARSDLLLDDSQGFVEVDPGKCTWEIRQDEIANAADITSATKYFELNLEKYGPYRINYTSNGRHLLLGGRLGHVAAFDWQTKKLHCEVNVMETVRDVQWLHVETMFAVAQKRWVFIYDNQGTELHCLKNIHDALRLEFLPYHFLLVASCGSSFLSWLDVSTGQLVKSFPTKEGRLDVMCQNPQNAIILTGSAKGTVSMWSPNEKEPLVKMLCHPCAVRGICVDKSGKYMATTGMDRRLRLWDIRMYKPVNSFTLPVGLSHLSFSQRRLLCCAVGTNVQIFKDICEKEVDSPYLVHETRNVVTDVQFCPYEDVVGVGHQGGFTSLIVPGSGEPNFDALECNPYQSKKQRREWEVKALLDKIQPEMISLDTSEIAQVDLDEVQAKLHGRVKILYVKPQQLDVDDLRHKKGRASSLVQRKQRTKEQRKQELFKQQDMKIGAKKLQQQKAASVLDRFS